MKEVSLPLPELTPEETLAMRKFAAFDFGVDLECIGPPVVARTLSHSRDTKCDLCRLRQDPKQLMWVEFEDLRPTSEADEDSHYPIWVCQDRDACNFRRAVKGDDHESQNHPSG